MSEEPTDPDIVFGLKNGDRNAWSALCQRYGERLWRYVSRLIGSDRDAVADVYQETMLAVARAGRNLDVERTKLWAWLAGIAHHQTALYWRHRYRDRHDSDSEGTADSRTDADPVAALSLVDVIEEVRRILAEMNPEQTTLLVAKYLDDQSVSEIVESTGGTTEGVRSKLARARRDYSEAIGYHQRTQPNRGIGNGTLSHYFTQQANAYEKLKRTKDAIDAAASAIVSWGRSQSNRTNALATLTGILRRAEDRNAYAVYLDEEAEREGQDRPIVRKALGKAYHDLKQYDRAIAQLRIAVRFQPNDRETHDLLIKCFEAQQDNDSAINQLLALIQLDRREEALYHDLGQRLAKKPKQQERAYTAMVEMKPHESESHATLANIRQQQNRWGEAIHHWQHVARIRSLEPTGLLRTAEAQIHQKQWRDAKTTLDQLDKKNWPSRFGNVRGQTSALRRRIAREK